MTCPTLSGPGWGCYPDARIKTWTDDCFKMRFGWLQRLMILIVGRQASHKGTSPLVLQAAPARRKSPRPEPRRDSPINWVAQCSRRGDLKGARREFELAVSAGYRAAQVDLAGLLVDASAGPSITPRGVAL
jgi:hypothetical protein